MSRARDWRSWFEQAGVKGGSYERGPKFETSQHAMEAAISGLGVAIVECALAAEPLRDRRLIAPFTQTLRTEKSYYLVYPRRKRKDQTIALFRRWAIDGFAERTPPPTRSRYKGKGL